MDWKVLDPKIDLDLPYADLNVWVAHNRGAQCIDKKILIRKNSDIDIDIEIDKRTFE